MDICHIPSQLRDFWKVKEHNVIVGDLKIPLVNTQICFRFIFIQLNSIRNDLVHYVQNLQSNSTKLEVLFLAKFAVWEPARRGKG